MKATVIAATLIAGSTSVVGQDCQPKLYAVGQGGFENQRLFQIDASDGQILSQTQLSGVNLGLGNLMPKALEFAPDGTLYAYTQIATNSVFIISPDDASAQPVGQVNSPLFEGGIAVIDNDSAYISNVGVSSQNFLLTIDLNTAAVNDEVLLQHDTNNIDLSGLVLREDGMLVGLDSFGREVPPRLVTIDPETGIVTTLANVDSFLNDDTAGLTIHNNIGYYVYNPLSGNPLVDPRSPELWSFDPYTGRQQFIGFIPSTYKFQGLAAMPCSAICLADVNADGELNGLDFGAWLGAFNAGLPAADQNEDGDINGLDFGAWLANFNAGCS